MTTLRINLWTKAGLAVLLVALGDLVIYGRWTGAVSALLAGVAVVVVAAAHPALFRNRIGICALLLAGAFALSPIERPSLLGWLFLWLTLAVAALAPRAGPADDVLRWTRRLLAAGVRAAPAALRDLCLLRKARRRSRGGESLTLTRVAGLLALPVTGGAVFTLLFAAANPVIAQPLQNGWADVGQVPAQTELAVEFDLPPNLGLAAVPALTLETVLTVLLQNSRQAGAHRVRVAARRAKDEIVIEVSDDGPGDAPGDRERLFEPFFTSRRAQGGTGLGLPIARSILAASAGRLDLARSAQGARFEIRLPAA